MSKSTWPAKYELWMSTFWWYCRTHFLSLQMFWRFRSGGKWHATKNNGPTKFSSQSKLHTPQATPVLQVTRHASGREMNLWKVSLRYLIEGCMIYLEIVFDFHFFAVLGNILLWKCCTFFGFNLHFCKSRRVMYSKALRKAVLNLLITINQNVS